MFDAEAARKAGYSDAEIAEYLASQHQFDAKAARKAGYSDTELIAHLVGLQEQRGSAARIPGTIREPEPEASESIGDKLLGGVEAGLTATTGLAGGGLGVLGGTLAGISRSVSDGTFGTPEAAKRTEQMAANAAQALTYSPRTQAGQGAAQWLGEKLQQTIPIVPLVGELGLAGAAAQNVGRASVPAVQNAARAVQKGVQEAQQRVMQRAAPQASPTPGTMPGVGATGVDMATQRRQIAESFPVPIRLTKGQASRDPAQLKFEVEAAKQPDIGAPLREQLVKANDSIFRNIGVFYDRTGAEAPNLRAVGKAVDSALVKQAERDKAAYRVAYKEAEKSSEMLDPVDLSPVAEYLNQNRAGRTSAPIMATLADEFAVQGVGGGSIADGTLQVGRVTLKQAEDLRKAINRFYKEADPNDSRVAGELRALIDAQTQDKGGALYRRARSMRQRYAQNYENHGVVARLMEMKRGTQDRAVALEDVFQHAILKGSLDDMKQVRRVLQRAGPEGWQAWRELQGSTVNWIRDQAGRNVATDSMGNRVVSAAGLEKAIELLDADGKLEAIFGKKGAETFRDLNDLAKFVKTVPPEAAVNTSNTAATVWGFVDVILSGMSGVPAPVGTASRLGLRNIRDNKMRRQISDALGEIEKRAPSKRKPPVSEPADSEPRVLH